MNDAVWNSVLEENAAVGRMFGGGSCTVTGLVMVFVPPRLSVTVRLTLYVPPAGNVCAGVAPVPVVLSPKFHW